MIEPPRFLVINESTKERKFLHSLIHPSIEPNPTQHNLTQHHQATPPRRKKKLQTPPKLTPPPAHTGKGYATEALLAFIPAFFAHMSATNPTATSINYICAETDQDNIGSQKVLLKCGFEFVERLVGGFDSPVLGLRDSVVYRVARPGTELEIGNGEEEEEEGGFVPPVQ